MYDLESSFTLEGFGPVPAFFCIRPTTTLAPQPSDLPQHHRESKKRLQNSTPTVRTSDHAESHKFLFQFLSSFRVSPHTMLNSLSLACRYSHYNCAILTFRQTGSPILAGHFTLARSHVLHHPNANRHACRHPRRHASPIPLPRQSPIPLAPLPLSTTSLALYTRVVRCLVLSFPVSFPVSSLFLLSCPVSFLFPSSSPDAVPCLTWTGSPAPSLVSFPVFPCLLACPSLPFPVSFLVCPCLHPCLSLAFPVCLHPG